MKKDHGYFIIEKVEDFHNYIILLCEHYKDGVSKVHMKKDIKEVQQFIVAFCKNELLPKNIEDHNKYWAKK